MAVALTSQAADARRLRDRDAPRHRAVGYAVPIVAGSSSVRVDAVGQVVTDFNPGQLRDRGRATGEPR